MDAADQGVLQEVQQVLGPLAPQQVVQLVRALQAPLQARGLQGLLQAVTEVDLVLHTAVHKGTYIVFIFWCHAGNTERKSAFIFMFSILNSSFPLLLLFKYTCHIGV